MPNCDPQDRFVYPYLTLMKDSYILSIHSENKTFLLGKFLPDSRYSLEHFCRSRAQNQILVEGLNGL